MTTSSSNSPVSSDPSSDPCGDSCAAADPERPTGLPDSEVVFDAATVKQAIDRLAVQINVELRDANPVFLAVMHGGLPFTADLLMRFPYQCDLAYVHVGSCGGGKECHVTESHVTEGGELRWHVEPTADLTGRTVLLVDDVLDRGEVLAALRARVIELGAAQVRAAVLVRKVVGNCVSRAEYIALESPNLLLFGRGMDLEGKWRNLPEIRATVD